MDPNTISARDWSELLVPLAREAGEAILEVYEREDVGVEEKSDKSPVTDADHAANEVILGALREAAPNVPILSEESAHAAASVREGWRALFLVDPLDGTKEFIHKRGDFTVNIAVVLEGRPLAGVVHAPALDATFYGKRGQGATRQQGSGAPEPIATAPWPTDGPVRVVASRSHLNDETRVFLEALPNHELVQAGSSLKFCRLAEGAADLYPRLAPTMEWDTCAAQAVLEAAGGAVMRADEGVPLTYNKPDLLNPHFVAAGDPTYFQK